MSKLLAYMYSYLQLVAALNYVSKFRHGFLQLCMLGNRCICPLLGIKYIGKIPPKTEFYLLHQCMCLVLSGLGVAVGCNFLINDDF